MLQRPNGSGTPRRESILVKRQRVECSALPKRTGRILRLALLTVLVATGPACVPYPIYKTLRPAAEATVLDSTGRPIPGAEVTLISSSYPYGSEKARVSATTGRDGVARFGSSRQWRIEALALHGEEVFFWNWCVQKEGYQTYATSRDAERFDRKVVVRLRRVASPPCRKPHDP